jgi:hypothetical protein
MRRTVSDGADSQQLLLFLLVLLNQIVFFRCCFAGLLLGFSRVLGGFGHCAGWVWALRGAGSSVLQACQAQVRDQNESLRHAQKRPSRSCGDFGPTCTPFCGDCGVAPPQNPRFGGRWAVAPHNFDGVWAPGPHTPPPRLCFAFFNPNFVFFIQVIYLVFGPFWIGFVSCRDHSRVFFRVVRSAFE